MMSKRTVQGLFLLTCSFIAGSAYLACPALEAAAIVGVCSVIACGVVIVD